MWIFYTAITFFTLLTGYFFIFPLCKKRPVLIKEGGLVAYVFVISATSLQFFGMWALGVTILILLLLYLLKPWFVYGVTSVKRIEAIEKAALATRTPLEKAAANHYKIDGGIEVKQYNLSKKTAFLSFNVIGKSKKAILTKIVFKKFIQNYFV